MSKVRAESSLPYISKSNRRKKVSSLGRSVDENNPESHAWDRLPMVKMTTVLRKIGAADKSHQMYIPCEEDQAQFKRSKMQQLKRQYSPDRYVSKEPFEGDLDDIVMDCYNYGENIGRKTVWKKYRQNCDQLSYDTLRLLRKR